MPPSSAAEAVLWQAIADRDPSAVIHSMAPDAEFDGPSMDAFVTNDEDFAQRVRQLVDNFIARHGTGRGVTTMTTLCPDTVWWLTCWPESRVEPSAESLMPQQVAQRQT